MGKFQADFGTIYRQPGHEVYHKWGEILAKSDISTKRILEKSEAFDENSLINEFSLKGYVKFDIILQSKGDKAKIHYEESKPDENDEIEK